MLLNHPVTKDALITAVFSSVVKTSVVSSTVACKKKNQTRSQSNMDSKPANNTDWVTVVNKKKRNKTTTSIVTKSRSNATNNKSSKTLANPKDIKEKAHQNGESKKDSIALVMQGAQPKHNKHSRSHLKNQRRNRKRAQEKDKITKANIWPSLHALSVQSNTSNETGTCCASTASETIVKTVVDDSAEILCLPYHILTEGIVSYLRPEEISAFAQCSKHCSLVAQDGFLWQTMFRQRFPRSQLSINAMREWKLAYQLTLSKIVDAMRCFHTKQTFFEDILGVGVDYTINPKTKAVDYIMLSQDLFSATAFHVHKVRGDVFGNKFKLFLPLYFSADHFQRALPLIQKTIMTLCPDRPKYDGFQPDMVLDVFPKIFTTFSVLLSDEGISASRKSFNGLTRIHRLFLALADECKVIKKVAAERLRLFVQQEKLRVKSACPNLGAILPLMMVVDQQEFDWVSIRCCYLEESMDRGVLWACKKYPKLQNTSGETESESEQRVELTREALTVKMRLLMFHVFFSYATCQGTTQQRANQYDRFFGQPDPELEVVGSKSIATAKRDTSNLSFSRFRDQINYIMNVSTWQEFFQFVGIRCPTDMAKTLRQHVQNSRRKKYHKHGMDFARIQQSGTSKILSKGQQYSASSNLSRVVFTDVWRFHGHERFLDATCILYRGKTRVETIDFNNKRSADNSVEHSGDVMRIDGGTHTIHLNLKDMDPTITCCIFVISAWPDAKMSDILSPCISFTDADDVPDAEPLCIYDLDSHDKVAHLTSVIMCKLYRARGGGWHVQAIGDAQRGAADDYEPIYAATDKLA